MKIYLKKYTLAYPAQSIFMNPNQRLSGRITLPDESFKNNYLTTQLGDSLAVVNHKARHEGYEIPG